MASLNPKKEYFRLIIALSVLFLILGGFLLYLSIPFLSETSVILSTEPVDPFDPIRGQYIIIRYEINNIPLIENVGKGDTVYVVLKEDESGVSRYDSAFLTKPEDGVFIKGNVERIFESRKNMRIKYGIEQYFFERNARFATRGMFVEVKLSDSGRAGIKELLDRNQEPLEINYSEKNWKS